MVLRISGCYKGILPSFIQTETGRIELELRVDVGGECPLNMVSGDIFAKTRKTRKYLFSFRFEEMIQVHAKKNEIILISDLGRFDPPIEYFSQIRVEINLGNFSPLAKVSWVSQSGILSKTLCKYKSQYFRTVKIEKDFEKGVAPFRVYEKKAKGFLFSHRSIPIRLEDVYAKAGIQIIDVKKISKPVPNPRDMPERGSVWTDGGLHDAMTKHFTMLKVKPQWRVWLFSAYQYEIPEVNGIMIAYKGKPRRGCAVFHRAIGGESDEERRMQLFVYVHELGHCFNLKHPGSNTQKGCGKGDTENSLLSWMSRPQRYFSSIDAYGEEEFWKNFEFRFTNPELSHLRHGFRNDVIFGGNDF